MSRSLVPGIVDMPSVSYLSDGAYAPRCLDPSFAPAIMAHVHVECLARGTAWGEGPVWFGDGRYLLWSDIPNDRILRWCEETRQVSVFRARSHHANGNTRDHAGRLVSCEHETRRVTRTEHDGAITVLADRFGGRRFNSPNDVITARDGSVWFTDPDYGLRSPYEGGDGSPAELPTAVYRIAPDGGVAMVDDGFSNPNGLCFSPSGDIVYVIDSGATPNLIWRCELNHDRTAIARRTVVVTASPHGRADGLRCDVAGNLWCGWGGSAGLDGVMVFGASGTPRAHIPLPERCANLCFGGLRRTRLFMAATHGLYALHVGMQGMAGG